MPDLSPRSSSRTQRDADRAAGLSIARVLLALVACDVICLRREGAGARARRPTPATHAARHLGAFSIAYGVGLLVVVVRPARARTMLPVAAVLAGALAITSVIDLAGRHESRCSGEAIHLPELISVLLIWLLAVPSHRRASRTAASDRGLDSP